ncbi:recombinase family protein [Alkalicaulis satelles]|uniref:Recombinase family protein n=1 Tax=Alkalicaulis satelles TaxID=2609175 RepID=A0A5M6ZFR0_9PROT|nr:recombinase family protein [Alkalicaulis satelles]KAA5803583.1 recombinase family protein [Alkalicaulis satelles]
MKDPVTPKAMRCAIYTRKSTENGLEQEYNSLDHQRDICVRHIEARAYEGWQVIPTLYDDGGVSGATMERPGLKALMADIRAGLVDVVITYRIDRLSRSVLDFRQLIAFFERHGVTFVSITEDFNTTTAMGRFALGIIMGFAELEREMASERVRSKIASAKRKGRWTGGVPPFGYRASDGRLIIVEEEAQIVRMIFSRFITMGSGTLLARALESEGVINRQGRAFDKGAITKMLASRVYIGEVGHKGEWFKGLHTPIIDTATWQKKEAIIARAPRERGAATRAQTPALLKGIIYGPTGRAMSPTFSKGRHGQLYRYYVDASLLKGARRVHASARVPAGAVEEAVIDRLRTIIAQPETIMETTRALKREGHDVPEAEVGEQLRTFDGVWTRLFPREQARIARLLIERVDVSDEGLAIAVRTDGFAHLALELGVSQRTAPQSDQAGAL